ncbi:MAG: ABC transporter transmembrane domain-containing protein [Pseudomonadota bacterium]|nr:ABC transporter transmembrane domain-containing protein [Pseudomonadota bacterium]
MAEKMTTFVWRHSARDQILMLVLTICSFPIIWISLELPKRIINDAIGGEDFPRELWSFQLDQTDYLIALCAAYLAAITANNAIKYVQNLHRGILGERMLRRMRFDLFRRVMGRPLSRLRTTSPGELVQMISAELAPIGDFIGAILATPVSQGGSFLVYLGFILAQNTYIGLAALCLYPVQAWLIPKLQAKVVAMIRVRLANIRAMAREIDESIDAATELRGLRARRWHMAIVSRQLYDNYKIRRRIFILKFLIKFVNNVANHLTPFFIFLIGGYFVIHGQLNIGALTAVLIAYKDLAAPWKELLRFYQDYSDMSARYTSIMENFDEDGEPEPLLDRAPVGRHALALKDAPVDGLSAPVTCHAPAGAMTAVVCEDAAARSALLQALSGLGDDAPRRWTASTEVLYRASVYVPADPRIFTGSIRSNLLHGLLFRPVELVESPERAIRGREAQLTGAPEDDTEDNWIDAAESGYDDLEAVETRMLDLVRLMGMEDDLYMIGLGCRLDMSRQAPLADKLLELRAAIAGSESLAEMRRDFIDVLDEDAYAPNATLAENLFFGLPLDPEMTWADYAGDRAVQRALDDAGVKVMLVEVGLDLCDTLISLFEGVAADSDLFKRYGLFPRAETPAIEAILRKSRARGPARLNRAEQARMLAIAFAYNSARYRLGVMRESERVEALLAARPRVRAALKDDPRFAGFDPDAYHPAMSIAENIFFGPGRVDRRDSWQPFKSEIDALVEDRGLRGLILRAGVDQQLGDNGVTLNALQRRKLGLARALIKRPAAIVLDGLAMTESGPDRALRDLLRRELDGGALIWGAASEAGAEQAEHVIRVDAAGQVSQGCGPAADDAAGARGVDGGSDAG